MVSLFYDINFVNGINLVNYSIHKHFTFIGMTRLVLQEITDGPS